MQAELALRCRKDIKNCAVQRRVVYYDMAEQSRRGAWKHVSWHVYILAGWRRETPESIHRRLSREGRFQRRGFQGKRTALPK
jgi:hypothetical protein